MAGSDHHSEFGHLDRVIYIYTGKGWIIIPEVVPEPFKLFMHGICT